MQRSLASYGKVQHLVGSLVRNRAFHIRDLSGKEYLDIGCGPNTHADTINLDYEWRPGIDVCWDVTRGLPLDSNSVRGIFTEHCFEHLPFAAVDALLGECRRVLKPGGTLRLVVPDGEIYLTRYARIRTGEDDVELPYAAHHGYEGIYSPILTVNRIFRAHGHQFIYDFDMFRKLLERNGFEAIEKTSFGAGRDARLLRDTEARAVESLYVEASKPLR